MSKKHQKQVEKRLIDIVNSHSNENKCGECSATFPTWASWNLGILLCGRCASVHRKALSGVSKVKSLTLDQWSSEQIETLSRIGNKRAKKEWNSKRVPFPYADDDDQGPIEEYFRAKYIEGRYRDESLDDLDDVRSSKSRSRSSSIATGGGGRSRRNTVTSARGRDIPRLSHRRLTQYEQSQHVTQVRQISNLGYHNHDSVLEALLLSGGNVEYALNILDEDQKVNPQEDELPPALPRRPASNSGISSTTGTTGYSENNPLAAMATGQQPQQQTQSNDWWKASGTGQPQQQPLQTVMMQQQTGIIQQQQPQIYQYTDPVTGQVSYIDSNGQQYIDSNNPQHQQQLLLQQQQQQLAQNPQHLAQQATKRDIMTLYNQPDKFTTNVVAPVGSNQSQQQQQQQQPQATGFGFQQQQPQQPQATGFGFQQQQPQQPQATGFGFQQQQPTGYAFQQQYVGGAAPQQFTGFTQYNGQQNGYQQNGQYQ
ncbi:protein Gts1p [[Candida] railenensis]|uniref:Protein Gts1p n=1 Tax=[Candida] railenensis TaxID=45579 RepID=A0A9P0QRL8_9ASCO|nr:protein Gts1p [[Candida] railenensis]